MKVSRLATAITAAATCAAIGLIVASCSNTGGSPVAPGVTSNLAANTSPEPSPTPTPTPTPSGTPCSPGFWKNHPDEFNASCGAAAALPGDQFTTCAELLTALTCKGSDASCGRSAAASALNTVSGCVE
jgi:hypothetical protein